MGLEDMLSKRPDSPLAQLVREDLDRLSIDELDERVALLEAEIDRTRKKRAASSAFRSEAEKLFRT